MLPLANTQQSASAGSMTWPGVWDGGNDSCSQLWEQVGAKMISAAHPSALSDLIEVISSAVVSVGEGGYTGDCQGNEGPQNRELMMAIE